MSWLTKLLAAISALFGIGFLVVRKELADAEAKEQQEKDKAELAPIKAAIQTSEIKVASDDTSAEKALDDYDSYRALHPLDGAPTKPPAK